VVLNYRHYLLPDFTAEFLLDREDHFRGLYRVAFYTHIFSGPLALLMGLLLVSDSFRRRFPKWHRRLGRVQVLNVLVLVAPSGLVMAFRAMTGAVAGVGFGVLAIATAVCAALGWRAAVERRFAVHRDWMWRCYLLLCSAILLRLIAGLAIVTGFEAAWFYPATAWASWVLPLAVYEAVRRAGKGRESFSRTNLPTGKA
jgi:signal transduction histidine kinase